MCFGPFTGALQAAGLRKVEAVKRAGLGGFFEWGRVFVALVQLQ